LRSSGSFRADVAFMLTNRAGVLVLTIISSALSARALGPAGRGVLAVALSFALILAQVANLGLTSANPYFASREPAARAQIVTNTLWLVVAIGGVVVGLGVGAATLAPSLIRGVSTGELALALAVVPATLAMTSLQAVLLGEGRTFVLNAIELLSNFVYVVLLAVGLFALGFRVEGVLALTLGRSLFGTAWFLFVLARRHSSLPIAPDLQLARRVLLYGTRVYIANLLAFLVIRADLLLVNVYHGAKQAGLYSVTVAVADALYLLPTAFATNLFPRVARGGSAEQSASVFRKVALVFAPICLLAVVLAHPAIRAVYGARFGPAAILFYWLIPGTFCLGMLNVLAHHFAGRGFPLGAVLVWFAGLGVNLSMNLTLLPRHGTYIAALSSSVAYALLLGLHMWMFAGEIGSVRSLIPRFGDVVALARLVGLRGATSRP
jgi:O-antigen/teichoic acid export membrane protein